MFVMMMMIDVEISLCWGLCAVSHRRQWTLPSRQRWRKFLARTLSLGVGRPAKIRRCSVQRTRSPMRSWTTGGRTTYNSALILLGIRSVACSESFYFGHCKLYCVIFPVKLHSLQTWHLCTIHTNCTSAVCRQASILCRWGCTKNTSPCVFFVKILAVLSISVVKVYLPIKFRIQWKWCFKFYVWLKFWMQ